MTTPPRCATTRPMPLIGAQISTAGGVRNAPLRALEIGAEALQIFSGNPRQWRPYDYTVADVASFAADLDAAGLPLYVHTIYLINLASRDPELWERSVDALAAALVFGAVAGAAGVVTHVGSHRGEGFESVLHRVTSGVTGAQERAQRLSPGVALPPLLLESSAGSGGSVGRDASELVTLLGALRGSPAPVGICLDTAHLFAAGHPVHTVEGLSRFLGALEEHRCLEAVGLLHLNDSRTPFGSCRDRHDNLWEGAMGRHGLQPVVRHAALRAVPFILETPGFDGHGPDAESIRRAKSMRASEEL